MIRVIGDCRELPDLLDAWCDGPGGDLPVLPRPGTIPCIVTSPPYNVAIPNYPSGYQDHVVWPLYHAKARLWARAMYRVLMPGGRLWLNVQQAVPMVPGGDGEARVNLVNLWANALEAAGFLYRDTVVWVQDSFDGHCAWGSWLQPTAPNLRGSSELILLYYKERWRRPPPPEWAGHKMPRGVLLGDDGKPLKDENGKAIIDSSVLGGPWEDLVRNVWKINPANPGTWHTKDPETGKVVPPRKNLPALYPIELPARAIRLSTWPGEWVLDPFAGHCTTGFAADQLGRESVMVDLGYEDESDEA